MPRLLAPVRWWPLLALALAAAPAAALADPAAPAAPAPSDEARRLEAQARLAARQGHCEAAMNEAGKLAALDPALHTALRADPAIEGCATRAAQARTAASFRALPRGARIRVQLADQRIVGTFAGVGVGTLLVDEAGGAPVPVRVEAMQGLEISRGRRSQLEAGVKWGLLAGVLAGAIITLAIGPGGDEDDLFVEYTFLPAVAAGTLTGAVIGGLRSAERWEPVPR